MNILQNTPINSNIQPNTQVSFNGKKASGRVTKFVANTYGKYILNSDHVRKFCEGCAKLDKKNASRHFQVFGSAVTSFAYMDSTLKSKKIEKKDGRTLATNQFLGFLVPSVAGYAVDEGMRNFNKFLEYSYSAKKEKEIALGKLDKVAKEEAVKNLGKSLKGFRCLMSIMTFTTIYRFVTPVAITPVANKVGAWLNKEADKKEASKAQEISLNDKNQEQKLNVAA